jgi:hypothetical protein
MVQVAVMAVMVEAPLYIPMVQEEAALVDILELVAMAVAYIPLLGAMLLLVVGALAVVVVTTELTKAAALVAV